MTICQLFSSGEIIPHYLGSGNSLQRSWSVMGCLPQRALTVLLNLTCTQLRDDLSSLHHLQFE